MTPSVFAFACRRIALQPVRFLLVGLGLLLVTALVSSALLLEGAIAHTANRVLGSGPSLVVSRVNAGGWAAIPVADAARIRSIPGVLHVTPRVWGVLPGPPAVTIMADPGIDQASHDAVAGSGLDTKPGDTLVLRALDGSRINVKLASTLPPSTNVVAADLLLTSAQVARRALLLDSGSATDLAVDSVRPEEDEALVADIAQALDYPVRVATRAQMRGAYQAQLGQRAGLSTMAALPALVALMLIVGFTTAGAPATRREVGLLKLLGWSTGEVARLHVTEVAVVASIATGFGLALAYAAVFIVGNAGPVPALLGLNQPVSRLSLDTTGAALVLVQAGATVLVPCLVGAFIPAWRLARVDPAELLDAP